MKKYFLAIIFLSFMFLDTAGADDKVYLYKPCSGEQNCIEFVRDNGGKESVQANPYMVLTKSDIRFAFPRRSGGFEGNIFLDIEFDKEVTKKINPLFTENHGKGIILVFNNKIMNINPPSQTIITFSGGTTYSFREWGPFLEKVPWLKDLIKESYHSVIGRNAWIYVLSSLGIMFATFVFVLFPRMRRKYHLNM